MSTYSHNFIENMDYISGIDGYTLMDKAIQPEELELVKFVVGEKILRFHSTSKLY